MSGREWFSVRWPQEVTAEQVRAGLLALHGLSTPRRRDALALEVFGDRHGVHHRLAVPEERRGAVVSALRHAIPGVALDVVDAAEHYGLAVWRIWLSTRQRPLQVKDPQIISGGLLAALGDAHGDERLVLRWVIGPVRRPLAVPSRQARDRSQSAAAVLAGLVAGAEDLDAASRTALTHKQGVPGWRAAGQVAVGAATPARRHQLLGRLAGALRVSQGPGVQLGLQRAWFSGEGMPFRRPLALNVEELVGLSGWPIDASETLPLDRVPSRLVPVPRSVMRTGRVLGVSPYPGAERPVALSVRDSATHLVVTGPTNAGKSTLLVGLAIQDIAAGRSLVFIDPKGDAATALLAHIPERRLDEVVLLDVADESRPVGYNPLRGSQRDPELIADQLLHLFKSLSGEAWGPRIGDVLHAALLTIAMQPQATLCALPLLLSDAGYRRQALKGLDDPFGLGPFWASYDALSVNERQQTIAPVMRRLRQLLLRPRLRTVLGQQQPRFDIGQVLTERKILLVSLSKGQIGPEASSLMGSLVLAGVWQALLGQAARPPAQRQQVMVYVDEVQEAVHGITDLGEMLAMARSHGGPLHLAHQHLGQLEPSLRSALDANARSRVTFQTSADDAAYFARGQRSLRPEDFQRLPRFHAYARLSADGWVTPYFSLKTTPLPEPVSDPAVVRARSRKNYGVDREQVEAELRALLGSTKKPADTPLGARRRQP
ncbi:MAG TPA: hypothetical protein VNA20_16330 [Frankiaceae bacterium]|nr:hypothetical protein [Frankiaceae bacterium]